MKTTMLVLVCAAAGIALGSSLGFLQMGGLQANASSSAAADALANGTNTHDRGNGPAVKVDIPDFDFGTMERMATMDHEFVFSNVGKAPLTLSVGETTCKCTVGNVLDGAIPPGGSTKVRLEWIAKTYEDQFRQSATILTNDPFHPRVQLSITGKVTEPTSLSPRVFDFGKSNAGDEKTSQVYVMSRHDKDFKITEHSFQNTAREEDYHVEILPASKEELPDPEAVAGYKVRLTLLESAPFGPIRGWLRLKTNLSSVKSIDVEFTGRVISEVEVAGIKYDPQTSLLNLGRFSSSEGGSTVMIVRGSEAYTENLDVEVDKITPDFLKAELKPIKTAKGKQYSMRVFVEPGAPASIYYGGENGDYGQIILKTSHPKVPELEIKVRFMVESE